MIKSIYETARLQLHLSTPDLSQSITDYFIRNKEFLANTESLHDTNFYTNAFQKSQLLKDQFCCVTLTSVKFWLSPKNSDLIIGMFALNNIVKGAFESCYLSYRLDKDYLNKGFMTEALSISIKIAFQSLHLHRIEANIMPKNKPSLKVVEKLNFQNEGLSKKYLKINGQWEDHIHMVLLNETIF
ncbi:MAG: GNAT family N-acetyltransferase [Eubacterium sp.]